jgi:hypothetical protein
MLIRSGHEPANLPMLLQCGKAPGLTALNLITQGRAVKQFLWKSPSLSASPSISLGSLESDKASLPAQSHALPPRALASQALGGFDIARRELATHQSQHVSFRPRHQGQSYRPERSISLPAHGTTTPEHQRRTRAPSPTSNAQRLRLDSRIQPHSGAPAWPVRTS